MKYVCQGYLVATYVYTNTHTHTHTCDTQHTQDACQCEYIHTRFFCKHSFVCVYMCVCVCVYTYVCQAYLMARHRVAKIHRMPYLYRSFPAKEPYN